MKFIIEVAIDPDSAKCPHFIAIIIAGIDANIASGICLLGNGVLLGHDIFLRDCEKSGLSTNYYEIAPN